MARNEQTQLPMFGDIVPASSVSKAVYSPDQLVGRYLVLETLTWEQGKFSPYVTIEAYDPATGEHLKINTGDKTILAQLQSVPPESGQMAFRIRPFGKGYQLGK